VGKRRGEISNKSKHKRGSMDERKRKRFSGLRSQLKPRTLLQETIEDRKSSIIAGGKHRRGGVAKKSRVKILVGLKTGAG